MAGPTLEAAIIDLWADGSGTTLGNPIGFAYVLNHPASGSRREVAGWLPDGTNNRAELMAVITGLEAINQPSVVFVYSDSEYVGNPFRQDWISRWKARGWIKVKNDDLWRRLVAAVDRHHHVQFEWVKGHSKIELNERCDRLAGEARKSQTPYDSGRLVA